MAAKPKRSSSDGWIDPSRLPPRGFIATAMNLAVVSTAQWHGELVAGLAAKRPMLSKAQMMRIGRRSTAYQTGLLDDKPHVLAVAYPAWLGMS